MSVRVVSLTGLPPKRRTCAKCGRLGHLSAGCVRAAKAHDRLGVEVEGWWRVDDFDTVRNVAEAAGMAVKTDGSLAMLDGYRAREFCTVPGTLGETISQVLKVYPHATHSSAGMHVHMSFNDISDTWTLASAEFLTYFAARWASWGTTNEVWQGSDFWKRLRGENESYCKVVTADMITSHTLTSDRYRQVNWCSLRSHKTVEFRLLPLFKHARLAVMAIEELVSIVEDFIALMADNVLSRCDREYEVAEQALVARDVASDVTDIANRIVTSDVVLPDVPAIPTGHTRLFGRRAREIERLITPEVY